MSWPTLLFFMTFAEAAAAYFIYVVYHYTFFPDLTVRAMGKVMLYVLPINLTILFLIEKVAGSANGVFFSPGHAGKNLYSKERAMARGGDREEACERLSKIVSRKGDSEALRLLIEIATEQPVLHLWMSKASGLKAKAKGLTREDHAGFDMMLGRMHKVEKKEEAAFY